MLFIAMGGDHLEREEGVRKSGGRLNPEELQKTGRKQPAREEERRGYQGTGRGQLC